jgi:hypothetical protein
VFVPMILLLKKKERKEKNRSDNLYHSSLLFFESANEEREFYAPRHLFLRQNLPYRRREEGNEEEFLLFLRFFERNFCSLRCVFVGCKNMSEREREICASKLIAIPH